MIPSFPSKDTVRKGIFSVYSPHYVSTNSKSQFSNNGSSKEVSHLIESSIKQPKFSKFPGAG